jgi:ribosomal protein S18 acetylase RimI-like enzyme
VFETHVAVVETMREAWTGGSKRRARGTLLPAAIAEGGTVSDDQLFAAGDHRVSLLRPLEDAPEVAALAERCADYAVLVYGAPFRPEEDARAFLTEGPQGKDPADVLKLGVREPASGRLVGLMEAVRGYPAEGTWYVGLLLLLPEQRGRGLGRAVARAFEAWAAAQDADRIMLSVVEENRRALRFWRALGFEVARKLPPRRFGTREHARLEMVRLPGAPVHAREGMARFTDAEGRVTVYPSARRDKRDVLAYLASKFEPGRPYTEREVNETLRRHHTFGDWALLRRDMFEAGLLGRAKDGARYWRPVSGLDGEG